MEHTAFALNVSGIQHLHVGVSETLRLQCSVSSLPNALVEVVANALDAGSSTITVQLLGSDQAAFSVEDNGCGITAECLNTLGPRYRSSKHAGHSTAPRSLGYRGEALASIVQLSCTTITSRASGCFQAYSRSWHYGQDVGGDTARPCAAQQVQHTQGGSGTRVEVTGFHAPTTSALTRDKQTDKEQDAHGAVVSGGISSTVLLHQCCVDKLLRLALPHSQTGLVVLDHTGRKLLELKQGRSLPGVSATLLHLGKHAAASSTSSTLWFEEVEHLLQPTRKPLQPINSNGITEVPAAQLDQIRAVHTLPLLPPTPEQATAKPYSAGSATDAAVGKPGGTPRVYRLQGVISGPAGARVAPDAQYFYVNGRHVILPPDLSKQLEGLFRSLLLRFWANLQDTANDQQLGRPGKAGLSGLLGHSGAQELSEMYNLSWSTLKRSHPAFLLLLQCPVADVALDDEADKSSVSLQEESVVGVMIARLLHRAWDVQAVALKASALKQSQQPAVTGRMKSGQLPPGASRHSAPALTNGHSQQGPSSSAVPGCARALFTGSSTSFPVTAQGAEMGMVYGVAMQAAAMQPVASSRSLVGGLRQPGSRSRSLACVPGGQTTANTSSITHKAQQQGQVAAAMSNASAHEAVSMQLQLSHNSQKQALRGQHIQRASHQEHQHQQQPPPHQQQGLQQGQPVHQWNTSYLQEGFQQQADQVDAQFCGASSYRGQQHEQGWKREHIQPSFQQLQLPQQQYMSGMKSLRGCGQPQGWSKHMSHENPHQVAPACKQVSHHVQHKQSCRSFDCDWASEQMHPSAEPAVTAEAACNELCHVSGSVADCNTGPSHAVSMRAAPVSPCSPVQPMPQAPELTPPGMAVCWQQGQGAGLQVHSKQNHWDDLSSPPAPAAAAAYKRHRQSSSWQNKQHIVTAAMDTHSIDQPWNSSMGYDAFGNDDELRHQQQWQQVTGVPDQYQTLSNSHLQWSVDFIDEEQDAMHHHACLTKPTAHQQQRQQRQQQSWYGSSQQRLQQVQVQPEDNASFWYVDEPADISTAAPATGTAVDTPMQPSWDLTARDGLHSGIDAQTTRQGKSHTRSSKGDPVWDWDASSMVGCTRHQERWSAPARQMQGWQLHTDEDGDVAGCHLKAHRIAATGQQSQSDDDRFVMPPLDELQHDAVIVGGHPALLSLVGAVADPAHTQHQSQQGGWTLASIAEANTQRQSCRQRLSGTHHDDLPSQQVPGSPGLQLHDLLLPIDGRATGLGIADTSQYQQQQQQQHLPAGCYSTAAAGVSCQQCVHCDEQVSQPGDTSPVLHLQGLLLPTLPVATPGSDTWRSDVMLPKLTSEPWGEQKHSGQQQQYAQQNMCYTNMSNSVQQSSAQELQHELGQQQQQLDGVPGLQDLDACPSLPALHALHEPETSWAHVASKRPRLSAPAVQQHSWHAADSTAKWQQVQPALMRGLTTPAGVQQVQDEAATSPGSSEGCSTLPPLHMLGTAAGSSSQAARKRPRTSAPAVLLRDPAHANADAVVAQRATSPPVRKRVRWLDLEQATPTSGNQQARSPDIAEMPSSGTSGLPQATQQEPGAQQLQPQRTQQQHVEQLQPQEQDQHGPAEGASCFNQEPAPLQQLSTIGGNANQGSDLQASTNPAHSISSRTSHSTSPLVADPTGASEAQQTALMAEVSNISHSLVVHGPSSVEPVMVAPAGADQDAPAMKVAAVTAKPATMTTAATEEAVAAKAAVVPPPAMQTTVSPAAADSAAAAGGDSDDEWLAAADCLLEQVQQGSLLVSKQSSTQLSGGDGTHLPSQKAASGAMGDRTLQAAAGDLLHAIPQEQVHVAAPPLPASSSVVQQLLSTWENPALKLAARRVLSLEELAARVLPSAFRSSSLQASIGSSGLLSRQGQAAMVPDSVSRTDLQGAYRVLGQVDRRFILVVTAAGVMLAIDQHAAHERVRLEHLTSLLLGGLSPAQSNTYQLATETQQGTRPSPSGDGELCFGIGPVINDGVSSVDGSSMLEARRGNAGGPEREPLRSCRIKGPSVQGHKAAAPQPGPAALAPSSPNSAHHAAVSIQLESAATAREDSMQAAGDQNSDASTAVEGKPLLLSHAEHMSWLQHQQQVEAWGWQLLFSSPAATSITSMHSLSVPLTREQDGTSAAATEAGLSQAGAGDDVMLTRQQPQQSAPAADVISANAIAGVSCLLTRVPHVFGVPLGSDDLRAYLHELSCTSTTASSNTSRLGSCGVGGPAGMGSMTPTSGYITASGHTVNVSKVQQQEGQQSTVGAALGRVPSGVLRVLRSRACRTAIMFGDALLPSECAQLIRLLAGCQLMHLCAHGRPTCAPLVSTPALTQCVHLHQQHLRGLEFGGSTLSSHHCDDPTNSNHTVASHSGLSGQMLDNGADRQAAPKAYNIVTPRPKHAHKTSMRLLALLRQGGL